MAEHSEVFVGLDVAKTCNADRTAAFRSPGPISRPSARIERASGSNRQSAVPVRPSPPPTGRSPSSLMIVMRRPCDGSRGFSGGRRTAQCKFSRQARLAHEIGFGRQSHDLLHGERSGPASGFPAAANAALGVQRHAMVPRQREQTEPGDIGDRARPLGQFRRLRLSRS